MVFFVSLVIRSTAPTQAVTSLCSGESAFYAAVKKDSIGHWASQHGTRQDITIQKLVESILDTTSRRKFGRIPFLILVRLDVPDLRRWT